MFSLNGTLYRICVWVYHFSFLNLLFLISCIPIITIPASLAALHGVSRKWILNEEPSIFKTFYKLFAENFKQSLLAGLIMFAIGLFLSIDFRLIVQMNFSLKIFILISWLVVAFLYTITLLYMFPVMVNYYFNTKQLLINSFKIGLYRIHVTIFHLAVIILMLYISFHYSFVLVFFYSSVAAFVTYWFANRKFNFILKIKEENENKDSLETDLEQPVEIISTTPQN